MADTKKSEAKPDYVYQAEAKKLAAEAEKLAAESRALAAEADKNEAEARRQQQYAEVGAIELKEKQRQYNELHADNDFHRIYRFTTDVSKASVDICMKVLDIWRRVYPGQDITIIFSSPGGDVVSGMALWDYLQELRDSGTRLITQAQGMAASMAGILLQAGDRRIMGRESYILIHQVQASMMGSFGDLQDRMKWLTLVQERILDIFAFRCSQATGRDSKVTRKEIEKEWTRTDWWLDSTKALALGFVDEIR